VVVCSCGVFAYQSSGSVCWCGRRNFNSEQTTAIQSSPSLRRKPSNQQYFVVFPETRTCTDCSLTKNAQAGSWTLFSAPIPGTKPQVQNPFTDQGQETPETTQKATLRWILGSPPRLPHNKSGRKRGIGHFSRLPSPTSLSDTRYFSSRCGLVPDETIISCSSSVTFAR
jgi:hypothetical protein